jgi:hypothetical protein
MAEYSGTQLIAVKGWVARRLVLYVGGTDNGGPLAPYLFFLTFEDGAGQKMYTLPLEDSDEGPLYPRLYAFR